MKTSKLLPWIAVPVVIAGVVIYLRSGNSGSAAAAPLYKTAVVARGDVTQSVAASGPLSAVATVAVGSQVSGNISKLYVDFNDKVTENQIIAEIEPSTYEAKRIQAAGDLASAKATLEMKQLTYKRYSELFQKKLVSDSDFDQARIDLRQQEATVLKAEAALKSAEVDVQRCTIRSPITGVVISRDVDLGQTVQASFSAPTLVTLAKDLREMQITANVSEADIGGVEPGQAVSFTVDAFQGRTFSGTVRQVRNNPTTTNNVVNYYTIIDVKNADLKLRPGMTANVTITTAKRSNVVRVPNSALRLRLPDNAELTAPAAPAAGEQPPADLPQPPAGGGDFSGPRPQGQPGQFAQRPQGQQGPSPRSNATTQKMVYTLSATPDAAGRASGAVTPIPVTVGLSDSSFTEVTSGLQENAVVATGTVSATAAAASSSQQTTNPFAPKPPPGPGQKR